MRVLVCDDSHAILECTRALLESHGHEVVTCGGFVDAFMETGCGTPFDVVICDGFDGDGLNLLLAVRHTFSGVKTILHSADSRLVEQERSRGYCGIVKGDSWDEVMRAVGEK